MIKIKPFYLNDNDLREIQEPYKSVALIIDKLRLPDANGNIAVTLSFKNTLALSCIRDIAEDLVENSIYLANRLM
jgi:hypothetical protein